MAEAAFTMSSLPRGYRASGILLDVRSLPSSYGIGDLGPAAFNWVDRLQELDQTWWHLSSGVGSAAECRSSFSRDMLVLSPDHLIRDGLIKARECESPTAADTAIDTNTVVPFKNHVIDTAWINFKNGARRDLRSVYEQFRQDQRFWIEDAALFDAIMALYGGSPARQWPAPILHHESEALDRVRHDLADSVDKVCFAQFLVARQAAGLRDYAHARGVRLIGDLDCFVPAGSSDLWAYRDVFQVDRNLTPRWLTGVTPDVADSRGYPAHPAFDWYALRHTGYRFWIERMKTLLTCVDLIRLHHFGAISGSWEIRAGLADPKSAEWVAGPGAELLTVLRDEFHGLPVLADDMAFMPPGARALGDQFGLSSARTLELAFDGHTGTAHLPHNYARNTVVYAGTADKTARQWFETLPESQQRDFWHYLRRAGGQIQEVAPALFWTAWSSVAAVAIVPLPDLLNLASAGRDWRCTGEMLDTHALQPLRALTRRSNRAGCPRTSVGRPMAEAAP